MIEIKTSEEILFYSNNFIREKKWVSLNDIIRELKKLKPVGRYNTDVDWCAIVELIEELENGKN